MPARTKYAPGTPSWIDLATPDMAAAKRFYGALFGWEFTDEATDDPANPYVMAMMGGKSVAGVMQLSEEMAAGGMPPAWSSYVTVADIDASATKVTELGGTVMQAPFDVMTAGRMAVCADPTGAVICLWQAKEHVGAELVNEHGTLTWNEIITPDVAKATEFYVELFGWGAETTDMGPMQYTSFMLGDRPVAGGMNPPMEGMPSFWGVYFNVDDTDALVEQAKGLGATVVAEPMDIPPGRMATLADTQGAMFNVLTWSEPTD